MLAARASAKAPAIGRCSRNRTNASSERKQQLGVDLSVLQVVQEQARGDQQRDDHRGRRECEPIRRAGPEGEIAAFVHEAADEELQGSPGGKDAGDLPHGQRGDTRDPGAKAEQRGDEQEKRRPGVVRVVVGVTPGQDHLAQDGIVGVVEAIGPGEGPHHLRQGDEQYDGVEGGNCGPRGGRRAEPRPGVPRNHQCAQQRTRLSGGDRSTKPPIARGPGGNSGGRTRTDDPRIMIPLL